MAKLNIILLLFLLPSIASAQGKNTYSEQKILNQEINKAIYLDDALKQPINVEPNWKIIQKSVAKKYRSVDVPKLIVGAKIRYYTLKKDWINFAKAYLTDLERYHPIENVTDHFTLVVGINNVLYDKIFKNITDRKILKRAAFQSRKIVENPFTPRPGRIKELELANPIDTYANLLYKAGKVKCAIKWQTKAVDYNVNLKEFSTNLERMRRGEKTW